MDGEHLSVVFLPCLYGEVVYGAVEQFDATVSGGYEALILVDFGPGDVVESVLCGITGKASIFGLLRSRGVGPRGGRES